MLPDYAAKSRWPGGGVQVVKPPDTCKEITGRCYEKGRTSGKVVRYYCNGVCQGTYNCSTNHDLYFGACPIVTLDQKTPQSRAHSTNAYTWVNYFDGLKSGMHKHAQCGRVPDVFGAEDRTDDIGLTSTGGNGMLHVTINRNDGKIPTSFTFYGTDDSTRGG